MTKALADPPPRATTAPSSFGNCECTHPSLFAVCEAVDLKDALVPLSTLLKGVLATNLKAIELATGTCGNLLVGNEHGLDSAKAAVEASLDWVEMQQVSRARVSTA